MSVALSRLNRCIDFNEIRHDIIWILEEGQANIYRDIRYAGRATREQKQVYI